MTDEAQITMLLQRLHRGDHSAESELMPLVYAQLHRLAERQFRLERRGHSLQPTALVSEFYLRIIRDDSIDWQSRGHFYAIAAQTIRRILVEHARAAKALRRPDPGKRIQIEDVALYSDDRAYEILMVDEPRPEIQENGTTTAWFDWQTRRQRGPPATRLSSRAHDRSRWLR